MNNRHPAPIQKVLDALAKVSLPKAWRLGLFLLFALAALFIVINPSLQGELTARSGTEYRFPVMAYDPADPFRGRYLQFTLDTSTVDRASEEALFEESAAGFSRPCYLTIEVDPSGLAYFDKVLAKPPEDGRDFVKARYRYGQYQLPLGHYYLPEELAPQAEKAFFENLGQTHIILKVRKGTTVVTGMYLGDTLIENVQF